MSEQELEIRVNTFLTKKKYIITLDDVRDHGLWERIACAFPNHGNGSRVIITTQHRNIVSHSTSNCDYLTHKYTLPQLSKDQAWDLFRSRAFRANPDFDCPRYLEDVAKSIVERCEGLPLAIVTVGGLMANKPQNLSEWRRIQDSLLHELQSKKDFPSVRRILSFGYDDLPAHLKPCFMCFGAFPAGEIKKTQLMRIWIAEGFVESVEGCTQEEVAMDYLEELVDRSLVQLSEFDLFGHTKFCRVHGFMREIMESKCREQNFYNLLHEQQQQQQHGGMPPANENNNQHGRAPHLQSSSRKIRRLSVHGTSLHVHQSMASLLPQSNRSSGLRSLIVATTGAPTPIPGPSPNLPYKFRKLRVLHLEGTNVGRLSSQVTHCRLLRYLSLRNTDFVSLPESLDKLLYLETLDLRGTQITRLPAKIINLHHLRQLVVPCPTSSDPKSKGTLHATWYQFAAQPSVKIPQGVGRLRGLVKLALFDIGHGDGALEELQNLTQVRKLGVRRIRREDGEALCAAIAKMSRLQSLILHSMGTHEEINLQSLSSPPQHLERLLLAGPLGKLPTWAQSLHSIVKIVLIGSKLMDDLFEALEGLPSLMHLSLIEAFSGKHLRSSERGFKQLKILHLCMLNELESVIVMEGAMPALAKLTIWYCPELKEVPSGIEHLTSIEELHLLGMPKEFVCMLRRGGVMEWEKVKHISLIRSSTFVDHQTGWVDEDLSRDMLVEVQEE